MVRILLAAALLMVCATQATAGAFSEETPAEFVNRFYRAYGVLRVRGVPNERQRRALAPFLSSELLGLCAKADHGQQAAGPAGKAAQKRSVKTGRCEGDLFTSNAAGCAETYAIAFPQPAVGRLIVPIHLADSGTHDAWVDELVLRHGHGGWVIADIVFTHDRQNRLFGRGTLRGILRECVRRMSRRLRASNSSSAIPRCSDESAHSLAMLVVRRRALPSSPGG